MTEVPSVPTFDPGVVVSPLGDTQIMSERSRHQSESGSPTQLRLLSGGSRRPDWLLDDRTRQVGRRGVAEARAMLEQAHVPEPKRPAPVRKAS
jgi:hypothetical protein